MQPKVKNSEPRLAQEKIRTMPHWISAISFFETTIVLISQQTIDTKASKNVATFTRKASALLKSVQKDICLIFLHALQKSVHQNRLSQAKVHFSLSCKEGFEK